MPLKKFRPNLSASREKSLAGAHQQLPTSSSASSAAVAESPTQLPRVQDTASLNSSHSTSDKDQLCEEAAVSYGKELSADEGTAGNDHTVQQSSTSASVQKINKVQRLRKKVAPCIPSRTRRLSARERASTSTPISDHNTKQTDQSTDDLPTPVSPPSRSITSLTATATPDTSSTHIADEWPLVPPSAAFNTPDNALTTNTSLSSSLLEQSTFTPTETTDTGITSTPSLSESHHVADNTAGSSGTSQVHVQSPESSEQHEEPIPRRRGRGGVARGRRGKGRRTPQAAETRSREEPSVRESTVASSLEPASNSSTPSKRGKRRRAKPASSVTGEDGATPSSAPKRRCTRIHHSDDDGNADDESVNGERFKEAPDHSKMTMQELIYYNPSSNPMSKAASDRSKRKRPGSNVTPPTRSDTHGAEFVAEEQREEEKEEEHSGRIVPELRINADGSIVIDESSMVVESSHQPLQDDDRELVTEDSNYYTTSTSFRQRHKITKWTSEETGKFYRALSQVGTDFTMMTLLLPKRSRKELKNKFKKEEKSNPARVTDTLAKLCSPTKAKAN